MCAMFATNAEQSQTSTKRTEKIRVTIRKLECEISDKIIVCSLVPDHERAHVNEKNVMQARMNNALAGCSNKYEHTHECKSAAASFLCVSIVRAVCLCSSCLSV